MPERDGPTPEAPGTSAVDRARLEALSRALPPEIRFGTSSWNYPGWRGLVYQRSYRGRGASAAMLEEYARFPLFRTVGIDSTFYAPPRRRRSRAMPATSRRGSPV